jgi:hypothetical protein
MAEHQWHGQGSAAQMKRKQDRPADSSDNEKDHGCVQNGVRRGRDDHCDDQEHKSRGRQNAVRYSQTERELSVSQTHRRKSNPAQCRNGKKDNRRNKHVVSPYGNNRPPSHVRRWQESFYNTTQF